MILINCPMKCMEWKWLELYICKMRKKWILSFVSLWLLTFLVGCFDRLYDYTSSFEDVDESSVTGMAQDSTLNNRSLKGLFDLSSKLVLVNLNVVSLDENYKEVKSLVGKITEDGDIYQFSVDEFSYPTSLVKIHYVCKLKDSTQDFKMEFSQYANIANGRNPDITLASAIKKQRIESLIENDAFSFEVANLKANRELYHILRLDSEVEMLKSSDSLVQSIMAWYVEMFSYMYLGGNFDSTFLNRFELLSFALEDESSWWKSVSEVEIAYVFVQNFKDRVIP